MTTIKVHVINSKYIIASEAFLIKKNLTNTPHFNLVVESDSDLLSLPPKLFDAMIKALTVSAIDIPEVTTSINTLISFYRAPPKEAI